MRRGPREKLTRDSATSWPASVDHPDSGGQELGHGAIAVARLNLDSAGGVPVHDHVEACSPCVQCGRLDAVVQREPGAVDGVDVPRSEELFEIGGLEPGIAFPVPVSPFVDDGGDRARVDAGVKLRAGRIAYAVDRPWSSLLGERAMVRGMPIP